MHELSWKSKQEYRGETAGHLFHYYTVTFEPPNSGKGGLGTYVHQSILQAERVGITITVICVDTSLDPGTIIEKNLSGGSRIISLNPEKDEHFRYLGKWPAISFSCAEFIIRLLAQAKIAPRFIEVCDGFGLAYYLIQRKLVGEEKLQNIPIVVTAHTPISLINQWSLQSTHRLPDYWIGEMERFSLTAADVVLCPSQYLADRLFADWGLNQREIHIVRNPYSLLSITSPAKSEPRERSTSLESESRGYHTYLAASRVQHFKGIPELIDGFVHYWFNGGTSKLIVAGADTHSEIHGQSLTNFLKTKHRKYLEQGLLEFVGPVPYEELPTIRGQCRALFHPSLHENLPYTVIEHMAAAGIVAASTTGGHAELISNGENGFLFEARNPADIARCIRTIDNLGASEVSRIGSSAREAVTAACDPVEVWAKKVHALSSHREPRSAFPFIRGKSRIIERSEDETPNLLSVVIPHFNLGTLLKETINSVLASSYKPIEIILVDDGSTDPASIEVVKEYENSNLPIQVIRKTNSGVADSRNTGARAATGEFLALLDADDLVTPDYYKKCVTVLQKYPNVGYVGSWNEDFDDNGTIRWWPTFNPEPPTQFIFNTTNCQGLVLRRQAFLNYGMHDPDLKMFLDDWESTISMLANDVRGVMLPEPLFRYRIRGSSIFRSKQGLWHLNYERIVRKHQTLVREYAPDAILFLNQNGPNTFYHNPTYPSGLGGIAVKRKYDSDLRQALSDLARSVKRLYRK